MSLLQSGVCHSLPMPAIAMFRVMVGVGVLFWYYGRLVVEEGVGGRVGISF